MQRATENVESEKVWCETHTAPLDDCLFYKAFTPSTACVINISQRVTDCFLKIDKQMKKMKEPTGKEYQATRISRIYSHTS